MSLERTKDLLHIALREQAAAGAVQHEVRQNVYTILARHWAGPFDDIHLADSQGVCVELRKPVDLGFDQAAGRTPVRVKVDKDQFVRYQMSFDVHPASLTDEFDVGALGDTGRSNDQAAKNQRKPPDQD